MTILNTIPIYTTPFWFICVMIGVGLILLPAIIGEPSDTKGVIAIICVVILFIGGVLIYFDVPQVYDHDEYIIELDDSVSATEFFKNYKITKTFEYSNAWQVKKKDGVK